MKEYGGYLSLEIREGKEYYSGDNVLSFNCARSALLYLMSVKKYSKIYIPAYLCESVRVSLLTQGYIVEYYNIDEEFMPILNKILDSEVILVTNYFGININQSSLIEKFKNVIFDNTQAFFAEPVKGAYNIYSCRKFFGVCDGAYLVGDDMQMSYTVNDIQDYVPKYASYLYDAINIGTNAAYEKSLMNEKQIEKSGICKMSLFSKKVLSGVDYDSVIKKRCDNYKYLKRELDIYNDLDIDIENIVPMVYPLFVKKEGIRKKLVERNIFIPQWWKYVLEEDLCNIFEKELAKYLIPLPIDQRYNLSDMKKLKIIIISML